MPIAATAAQACEHKPSTYNLILKKILYLCAIQHPQQGFANATWQTGTVDKVETIKLNNNMALKKWNEDVAAWAKVSLSLKTFSLRNYLQHTRNSEMHYMLDMLERGQNHNGLERGQNHNGNLQFYK